MILTVITPVGPGHEKIVDHAIRSVMEARRFHKGPFSVVNHQVIDDTQGKLGRSKARNLGMLKSERSNWYFFLDADDMMEKDALIRIKPSYSATFGKIKLNSHPNPNNVFPCEREDLFVHGANGTLVMGCFVKSEVALRLKFNEDIDAGEDFDFYMRLPDFIKINEPLVTIGYDVPSATGPRGYDNLDWWKVCKERINTYK